MRNWLREIIRSVIKEEIHNSPLIICAHAPSEDDVYAKNTMWLHGNDKYIAKEVKVTWVKL